MIKSSVEECAEAYNRGCEVTTAAIKLFGYSFAESVLSINYPQRLKGSFKSEAHFQHTKGCFDTLKKLKPRGNLLG